MFLPALGFDSHYFGEGFFHLHKSLGRQLGLIFRSKADQQAISLGRLGAGVLRLGGLDLGLGLANPGPMIIERRPG
jgi:hypothetical protein